MLAIVDVSGIQQYVFDLPSEGGGQAARLRARSFLVQAQAPQGREDWKAMFQRIEKLFHRLCKDADAKLNTARFPNPPA